ncbi:MAG: hypothetical protein LBN05_08535 [Oscillospiraceae bacterium]|jgi:hypothetical protein|nr:hypothetical protein [Oscillospiraceae bacterium]
MLDISGALCYNKDGGTVDNGCCLLKMLTKELAADLGRTGGYFFLFALLTMSM